MKKCSMFLIGLFLLLSVKAQDTVIHATIVPPKCFGGNEGRISLNLPLPGKVPQTILWNTPAKDTTPTIDYLTSGIYSVTVTDDTGRFFKGTFTVYNPIKFSATYTLVNNLSWPNTTGQIIAHCVGRQGKLFMSIKDSTDGRILYPNQGDSAVTGLASGTYYLYLRNQSGCEVFDTVRIKEWSGMTPQFDIDRTACYSPGTDGLADVNIRPGLGLSRPVTISVDGDTVRTLIAYSGIPTRPYVLDGNDTVDQVSFTVDSGYHDFKVVTADHLGFRYHWWVDAPHSQITAHIDVRNISCTGDQTGELHVDPDGSYGEYEIAIDGPFGFSSTDFDNTDLYAGRYRIRVEDSTGECYINPSVRIHQPDRALEVQLTPTHPTCFGFSNGAIHAEVDGGSGTWHFAWNDGVTTRHRSNLGRGNYSLTVTDSLGCTAMANTVLLQPQLLRLQDFTVFPSNCYHAHNGNILTDIVGGTGSYVITWHKGTSVLPYDSEIIDNLSAGTYALSVKDSFGCPFDTSFVVTEPARPNYTFIVHQIDCNDNLGSVGVINNAGILRFSTAASTWNVPLGDTTFVDTLRADTHRFTVSVGICSWDTTVTLVQPLPLVASISTTDNVCFGGHAGTMAIQVHGGTSGALTRLSLASSDTLISFGTPADSFFAGGLSKGKYVIRLVDEGNCRTQESVNINGPEDPLRPVLEQLTKAHCNLSADAEAWVKRVEHSFGTIQYQWSSGQAFQRIDSLLPGTYSVRVIDENGCSGQDSIVLLDEGKDCYTNIITDNGDGYNDLLDLSDLCRNGISLEAEIVSKNGIYSKKLTEVDPIWSPNGFKVPSGKESTFRLHFVLSRNGNRLYEAAEWITVITNK